MNISRLKFSLTAFLAMFLMGCNVAAPLPQPTASPELQPAKSPAPSIASPTQNLPESPVPVPNPTRTPQAQQFRLWVYLMTYLDDDTRLEQAIQVLDRAAASGYSGVVLADSNLESPDPPPAAYISRLQQFLTHARSLSIMVVPLIYQFGWSDSLLYFVDPNLAEGLPVFSADFKVAPDGRTLQFISSFDPQALPDGGFEHHAGVTFTDWTYQSDSGIAPDTQIVHSGRSSLRLDKPAEIGLQNILVQPGRQYHVRYWARSQTLKGKLRLWLADANTGQPRSYSAVTLSDANTWTQIDLLAYSASSTTLNLYIGRDDGYPDDVLWLDDISIEETALVSLLRRAGTPLRIYDQSGTEYAEVANFNPIVDPLLLQDQHYTYWHEPPQVTLQASSALKPGAQIKMDFYFALPIDPWEQAAQIGASLTAPEIQDYMTSNINMLAKLFPADTGFMLGYDEMREMNTAEDSASRGLTAGQLLAWHVGQSSATVRKVFPGAQLYFWSDMFDPNANAVDNYYLVGRDWGGKWNGDISGSWEGLPPDAIIFNWNLEKETPSLRFFASRGLRQIIAGYYDSGDGSASATKELEAAQSIPDIVGIMYTTWTNDYSQLENYAAAVNRADR